MTLHTLHFEQDPEATYTVDLPVPLAELDDDYALHLLRTSIATLAKGFADDVERMTTGTFSDDDTDYFPARANTYAALTMAIVGDFPPAEAFRRLVEDYDFVMDMLTVDTKLSIDIQYKD